MFDEETQKIFEEMNRRQEEIFMEVEWQEYRQQVFFKCLEDAINQFPQYKLQRRINRVRLTQEQKDEVVEYLKQRAKYYEVNGLII